MVAQPVRWSSPEGRRRSRELPPKFSEALDDRGRVGDFWLNARPDPVDFRDQWYFPGLVEIKPFIDAPKLPPSFIRDQGPEGSCTGHALGATIDIQNLYRRSNLMNRFDQRAIDELVPERVSVRMLYEMARTYDEYPDDGLGGSSARGVIKGFFHNGVCSEARAPYIASEPGWTLEVAMAKEARTTSLGAYYRLRHVLYDYHAALNEVGAVMVSAMVHDGWQTPRDGHITMEREPKLIGAHAFAIVGYDLDGFIILNSWGPNWAGDGAFGAGFGHWSYEDWKAHVLDAWVLRLAVPSAKTFHLVGGFGTRASQSTGGQAFSTSVPRIEINGHFIHVRNGQLVRSGNYWNNLESIRETAELFKDVGPDRKDSYRHLLFYAHGGLNNLDSAVRRAAVMTPVFKALKIYPIFFLWRTGFWEELLDVLRGPSERTAARVQEFSDLSDVLLEGIARPIVRPIWQEMKADGDRAVARDRSNDAIVTGEGFEAARLLIEKAAQAGLRTHFVGHSAGAVLLGHLLRRGYDEIQDFGNGLGTISLFAPACTAEFFDGTFLKLESSAGAETPEIAIYNLSNQLEREDTVGHVYRKSLLYLVSNALEAAPEEPLVGFERVARRIAARNSNLSVYVSDGTVNAVSQSRTHGGFDEDPATLNHLTRRILASEEARTAAGTKVRVNAMRVDDEPFADVRKDAPTARFESWMFGD